MTNGALWSITFQQEYKGISVQGTQFGFTVDRSGRLITFGVEAYPNIDISVQPSIDKVTAFELVQHTDQEAQYELIGEPALIILPLDKGEVLQYQLVWRIFAQKNSEQDTADMFFYVDAQKAEVISHGEAGHRFAHTVAAFDLASDVSEKRQTVMEREAHPEAETASISLSGKVTYEYWKEPNQAMQIRNFAGAQVRVLQGSTVVAETYSDTNGNYSFNLNGGIYTVEFAASTVYAQAVQSAVPNIPLVYQIQNVDTNEPKVINFLWDHAAHLAMTACNGSISCVRRANIANLMTEMHDYLTTYPLSFSGLNITMPFGLGWYPRDAATLGGPNFRLGEDPAQSSDIIHHEYTHGAIWILYGGQFIESDPSEENSEADAMDEGFADYFAAAESGEPEVGEDVYWALTRDLSDQSVTMNDWLALGNSQLRGQIIAGAVWDLKNSQGFYYSLGQPANFDELIDSNAFWALWLAPHPTDFLSYFTHFVDAFDASGEPWFDPIVDSFCNRGIDTGYCVTGKTNNRIADVDKREESDLENFSFTAYPNPFKQNFIVEFSLPDAQHVRIEVYDMLGRKVALFLDGTQQKGRHTLAFDAGYLPGGVYLLRLETSANVQTRSLILHK